MRIGGSVLLPATRRSVTLHTADGEELAAELSVPVDRPPAATLVCLHPLPTHGGSMDAHVIRKMAARLPALAGLAVLRLNTRGTAGDSGRSSGSFGHGEHEQLDVAAALDLVEAENLPAVWLVGWSFGADLAVRHGCDPTVVGAVLLAPPLRFAGDADLDAWAATARPLVAIVPEFDDYLRPVEARERFARVPSARVVDIPGAKHLFVGCAEAVLEEIVRAVHPAALPLRTTWPASEVAARPARSERTRRP